MTRAPDFAGLLRRLLETQVEFILIGGMAGVVHGAARTTFDIDIVYKRASTNLSRLVEALAPLSPALRGAPAGLPFVFDAETLRHGLNFTLTTTLGDTDLFGEVTGGGFYEDLLQDTIEIEVLGARCRCVTLAKLIQLKRAAGRAKDREALAELEALAKERSTISPTAL